MLAIQATLFLTWSHFNTNYSSMMERPPQYLFCLQLFLSK